MSLEKDLLRAWVGEGFLSGTGKVVTSESERHALGGGFWYGIKGVSVLPSERPGISSVLGEMKEKKKVARRGRTRRTELRFVIAEAEKECLAARSIENIQSAEGKALEVSGADFL